MKTEKISNTDFSPNAISAGNDSKYDIKISMNLDGKFHIDSTILIKNTSKDTWGDLFFYFIPNVFTEKTAEQLSNPLDSPGTVQFYKVAIEGEQVDFTLDTDTLRIPLKKKIEPEKEITVEFSYDLTLPENGLRFTKSKENFYLAQFYPMVATFREHKWNKEDYRFRGETYHTAFSDFKITYDIPDEFTVVSTSEDDKFPSENKENFEVQNVKEIFLAILKKPFVIQKLEGDVNIRVFGFEQNERFYNEISEVASDALNYFEKNIGPYPSSQLDIVLDGLGMEYPGIVTANSIYNGGKVKPDYLKNMIVHEIAHQWFYGVISNDPFNDVWLDEGFSEFAAGLYQFSKSKEDIPYQSMYQQIEHLAPLPVNLPLDKYVENQSPYTYGKSNVMLWKLFEKRGGVGEAEKFLKTYYDFYKYKEVNSEEFVRFTKHYFKLEDESVFKDWLLLK
ncbi:M1 family metallopeptidase [Mesobacillus zeae]|uniref:M1 family peptidase n=2 Tax=Mesobacillus zeae TaxID=1917180 RepID=A0A398B3S4_9BACI|nr:M1 family metallopeptidase [Mesobacillus zeae]RID82600.1 M1 family peptidase [Mesobacillus zeae]